MFQCLLAWSFHVSMASNHTIPQTFWSPRSGEGPVAPKSHLRMAHHVKSDPISHGLKGLLVPDREGKTPEALLGGTSFSLCA